MKKIEAKIIADSISPQGNRITSFLLTYPRFIHSELMTHRVFSRNSASCLTGDTLIYINKPSKLKTGQLCNQPMRLDNIVNKWFKGDSKGRSMKTRLKQLNLRHLNEDTGEYDSIRLVDCFKQGKQKVYEIELEDGYKLKCTDNHRILSENGWITLSDFDLQYNGEFCSYLKIPKIATNGTTFNLQVFINGKSEGKSLREICAENGYLEKSASEFCRRNGLSFSRKKVLNDEILDYLNKDWLISKKELGLTNGRIAELCNTTEDRIKKACKKLNISGYIGTVLKEGKRRESWNKGKTYSLPDESLVNVRRVAKNRIKKDSYKYYKDFNVAITRFLNENRKKLLEQADYTCKISGSKSNLELHHIDPVWNNKETAFSLNNIIVLNSKVHRFIHSNNLDLEFLSYYNSGDELSNFIDKYKDLKLLCDDINKPKSTGNKLVVKYRAVKNIKFVGIEETYDLEVEGPHHNFIANGIVVHNSRAIPFEKMVKMVEEDPFTPISWQFNHKGMQGVEYVTEESDFGGIRARSESWLLARDYAIQQAKDIYSMDTTKQLCNRLLEPFMWHTTLVTATDFTGFFELRCPQYVVNNYTPIQNKTKVFYSRKDTINFIKESDIKSGWENCEKWNEVQWQSINNSKAEIHIQALAEAMFDAMNESKPKHLDSGEWHIPDFGLNRGLLEKFISDNYMDTPKTELKIATAHCAKLSYNNHGNSINFKKDIALHDQLLKDKHFSPFEHCARAMSGEEYYGEFSIQKGANHIESGWCNNFRGFINYRYILENQ